MGKRGVPMREREPNLVTSSLSGRITRDGITVEVSIIRLEHSPEWTLEVVNPAGTSIVWDDPFLTDDEAFAEFEKTVKEEGIACFLDSATVIPFRKR